MIAFATPQPHAKRATTGGYSEQHLVACGPQRFYTGRRRSASITFLGPFPLHDTCSIAQRQPIG